MLSHSGCRSFQSIDVGRFSGDLIASSLLRVPLFLRESMHSSIPCLAAAVARNNVFCLVVDTELSKQALIICYKPRPMAPTRRFASSCALVRCEPFQWELILYVASQAEYVEVDGRLVQSNLFTQCYLFYLSDAFTCWPFSKCLRVYVPRYNHVYIWFHHTDVK